MSQSAPRAVLIVDDSMDMRVLLTMLLESRGYLVQCRNNGQEALEYLNSGSPLPSVILLDLRMPIMNGLDFLEVQSHSTLLKNIPIVMMTADDDLESITNRFHVGQILSKPLQMHSVLSAVERNVLLH